MIWIWSADQKRNVVKSAAPALLAGRQPARHDST